MVCSNYYFILLISQFTVCLSRVIRCGSDPAFTNLEIKRLYSQFWHICYNICCQTKAFVLLEKKLRQVRTHCSWYTYYAFCELTFTNEEKKLQVFLHNQIYTRTYTVFVWKVIPFSCILNTDTCNVCFVLKLSVCCLLVVPLGYTFLFCRMVL